MENLTQSQIEQLDEEEYSYYLAFGESPPKKLNEEEYERYLKSHLIFDL
tara:strand:- start:3519 stop:3665 length:147 start_codon:yes stop_codon:yes gene_type:complete